MEDPIKRLLLKPETDLETGNRSISNYGPQADFYSLIFQHYPDAIFTVDIEGNFLNINDKVEDIIGYKPEELTGGFHHLVNERELGNVLNHFELALKGEPQNYHCAVIHKQGHLVHVYITTIPIKVNGEIIGLYNFAKNLTDLYQKETELLKITNSLNLAQEVAKIGSWDCDTETENVYCSKSLLAILGINNQDTVPTYDLLLQMALPEDRERIDRHFNRTKQTGADLDLEFKFLRPDSSIMTVHLRGVAKKDSNGRVHRIIGVIYDISEQVIIQKRLMDSEKKFETIAGNIDVGIWSMDVLKNKIVYGSPGLVAITGYTAESFLSGQKSWAEIIHPDDRKAYWNRQEKLINGEMIVHQYRILHANGEVKWIEDKTFPILNTSGQLIRLDGIVQDISDRKRNEEEINFYAFHDYLTELPNRRMFDKKLKELISECQETNDKFALFYLDLDRFKFVNDTLGHEMGDRLLREISKRLASLSGDQAVFRLGGDEFAIIHRNLLEQDPVLLGKEIVHEIEKTALIESYEIHITTSVGISIFPEDGETIKQLIANSDAALYRAKELGKNNAQLFSKSLNIEAYKKFILENDLRRAIQREEFILHYQPKVDALTGDVIGAEALIRWNHSNLGLVPPAEFIPLAEETGLINEMSSWVIQQVCKQLREWEMLGLPRVPVSINLSAKTLRKADLVPNIQGCLIAYSIPPGLIEIEITEDSLIKTGGSALLTIQQLRDLGLSIAIDDFGTGYSSIGYLKKFKVDTIKIDRSYIKDIYENSEDSTIVQSIILLARGLRLKIVAEGVETEKQWEILKRLDCHYLQGFLFSKPVPAEQFTTMLAGKANTMPL
ncbi:EAL domain-containing protein [Neobacillus sp. Marseille-QA0830]